MPSPTVIAPDRPHGDGAQSDVQAGGISRGVTLACAIACGAMVGNLYYAQPLIGLIAPELRLSDALGGMIVTLTQLGYGLGLLFVVPLADRIENRRLILASIGCTAVALAGVAAATGAATFLAASILLGFSAAGAQVVVPYAAALATEEKRGATIGNVMAGLLAGIMLARPIASMLTELAGWRIVFWLSAGLMLLIAAWLARALPRRRPPGGEAYGAILRSMGRILLASRPLQRRAVYQGLAFASFNIFWTAAPLMLGHSFGFGQTGIALFALAGAAGALAAPIAGRLGNRGYVRIGTALALATIAAGCLLSGWSLAIHSILALVVFGIAIDGATQVNQVLGQRVIYGLDAEARGRINAIYMTIVFLLGAGGSAIATLTYHHGGWRLAMGAGGALALLALGLFATERRR